MLFYRYIKKWQPRGMWWGGRGGKVQKGYMCTYDWFMLRFDRHQQSSVKQLYFNKKINQLKESDKRLKEKKWERHVGS